MTEHLNVKSSEIGHFVIMIHAVYLDHGIFHPPMILLIFLQTSFREGSQASKLKNLSKKVLHLYDTSYRACPMLCAAFVW